MKYYLTFVQKTKAFPKDFVFVTLRIFEAKKRKENFQGTIFVDYEHITNIQEVTCGWCSTVSSIYIYMVYKAQYHKLVIHVQNFLICLHNNCCDSTAPGVEISC